MTLTVLARIMARMTSSIDSVSQLWTEDPITYGEQYLCYSSIYEYSVAKAVLVCWRTHLAEFLARPGSAVSPPLAVSATTATGA